jgi:hypothetical protein
MARPTKITPEIEAAIVEALTAGASRRDAAEYAGISVRTLERAMRRNVGFVASVTRAEARCAVRASYVIRQAFEGGDWHAALVWLERRRPAEWARRDHVEIEIRRVAEQVAQQTGADPDWLVRRAAEIAASASKDR